MVDKKKKKLSPKQLTNAKGGSFQLAKNAATAKLSSASFTAGLAATHGTVTVSKTSANADTQEQIIENMK